MAFQSFKLAAKLIQVERSLLAVAEQTCQELAHLVADYRKPIA